MNECSFRVWRGRNYRESPLMTSGRRVQAPTGDETEDQQKDTQEALERLFEIPVFVIFRMMLTIA